MSNKLRSKVAYFLLALAMGGCGGGGSSSDDPGLKFFKLAIVESEVLLSTGPQPTDSIGVPIETEGLQGDRIYVVGLDGVVRDLVFLDSNDQSVADPLAPDYRFASIVRLSNDFSVLTLLHGNASVSALVRRLDGAVLPIERPNILVLPTDGPEPYEHLFVMDQGHFIGKISAASARTAAAGTTLPVVQTSGIKPVSLCSFSNPIADSTVPAVINESTMTILGCTGVFNFGGNPIRGFEDAAGQQLISAWGKAFGFRSTATNCATGGFALFELNPDADTPIDLVGFPDACRAENHTYFSAEHSLRWQDREAFWTAGNHNGENFIFSYSQAGSTRHSALEDAVANELSNATINGVERCGKEACLLLVLNGSSISHALVEATPTASMILGTIEQSTADMFFLMDKSRMALISRTNQPYELHFYDFDLSPNKAVVTTIDPRLSVEFATTY